mmetsp:Transcript_47396/g.103190  ORF Transcript_47396/g.103190 Transcript_47396/m.103190 type:complete len:233 (+) Transcript_47396:143-841(+)
MIRYRLQSVLQCEPTVRKLQSGMAQCLLNSIHITADQLINPWSPGPNLVHWNTHNKTGVVNQIWKRHGKAPVWTVWQPPTPVRVPIRRAVRENHRNATSLDGMIEPNSLPRIIRLGARTKDTGGHTPVNFQHCWSTSHFLENQCDIGPWVNVLPHLQLLNNCQSHRCFVGATTIEKPNWPRTLAPRGPMIQHHRRHHYVVSDALGHDWAKCENQWLREDFLRHIWGGLRRKP